jgi:hypothetical protein
MASSSSDDSILRPAAPVLRTRFRLLSDELDSGKWLDGVLWDDAAAAAAAPLPLIIDLNDPLANPRSLSDLSGRAAATINATPTLAMYNVSNDDYYMAARRVKLRQKLGRTVLAHAPVVGRSLLKLMWTDNDLRRFHRPFLQPVDRALQGVALEVVGCTDTGDAPPLRCADYVHGCVGAQYANVWRHPQLCSTAGRRDAATVRPERRLGPRHPCRAPGAR